MGYMWAIVVVVVVVLTEVRVYILMWNIKCKKKFLQRNSLVFIRLNLCYCCYQHYCIVVCLAGCKLDSILLEIKCQSDLLSVD